MTSTACCVCQAPLGFLGGGRGERVSGLLCSETLAGTDELKGTLPVQDQRRHRGYNRVVLLLYLHYRQFSGDRLCAAVWELCTLFCQSKRSGS